MPGKELSVPSLYGTNIGSYIGKKEVLTTETQRICICRRAHSGTEWKGTCSISHEYAKSDSFIIGKTETVDSIAAGTLPAWAWKTKESVSEKAAPGINAWCFYIVRYTNSAFAHVTCYFNKRYLKYDRSCRETLPGYILMPCINGKNQWKEIFLCR